ncbi:CRISPR-associated protein Cas5 [Calothrix parietina]|uniref:CRISPR-associated protein Cas5 n=1 Tax=Calothrix parietina TaxID=32054 RepID=UPI0036F4394E
MNLYLFTYRRCKFLASQSWKKPTTKQKNLSFPCPMPYAQCPFHARTDTQQ